MDVNVLSVGVELVSVLARTAKALSVATKACRHMDRAVAVEALTYPEDAVIDFT